MTHTEHKLDLSTFPEALDLVFVEGGCFWMGGEDKEAFDREKPLHEVEISSFYIGKYPVTQALWQAVMKNNPSYFKGAKRPVERVSWKDCEDFLKKLYGATGRKFRLLTEAEWEYAAAGGKKGLDEAGKKKHLYAGSDKLEEVGWFSGNSHRETKGVGQKYPNALGIYDMSGNVYEWCQDWFDEGYYQMCSKRGIVENPKGPESGSRRVLRGGYWLDFAQFCRVAFRLNHAPEYRFNFVGFRLALSP